MSFGQVAHLIFLEKNIEVHICNDSRVMRVQSFHYGPMWSIFASETKSCALDLRS